MRLGQPGKRFQLIAGDYSALEHRDKPSYYADQNAIA